MKQQWIWGLGLGFGVAVGLGSIVATPLSSVAQLVVAQANFDSVSLSAGFSAAQGTLRGRTGGQVSLPSIVANRDRANVICSGFGSSTPDHIITLEQDFSRLTLQVNSNGNDSALVVRGPDGVRCGSDISRTNLDDQLTGNDWSAGSYEVWVGSSVAGDRFGYTLNIGQ
ncbi:hypothetical protein ACQ4M4_06940 [Leptolyngbya sp. AN02str]|uniref:hypothetical protein n=1 Tax=Leptolyngbya sp. AN02str TaxID=3423363 RepID=UPI003D31C358